MSNMVRHIYGTVDPGFLVIRTDYTDTNGVKIPYKKAERQAAARTLLRY